MPHFGLAMLLWWPRERAAVVKGSGTRGGAGTKRAEPEPLSADGAKLVGEFERFLRHAQFCLRSKGPEDAQTRRVKFEVIESIVTEDGKIQTSSSLSGTLLPKVESMGALLSRYTFKLVDESDAATLQTEPHWQLELYSVREDGDYSYKPNDHWVANLVVVLYDQLPQMTDMWLKNNEEPWSLDPSDVEIKANRPPDTYGIPPTNSLRYGSTCEYNDRDCVRVVSMCGDVKTKPGHSAQGLVASAAKVGQVGISVFPRGVQFPPSGYVYVVPFELPESAIVERELTAELDCALCFESKNTKLDQGMIIGGCGHYICRACCEDEQYNMGIKKLEKCPTCRRPCALAPELKGVKMPFEFKYHCILKDLLEANEGPLKLTGEDVEKVMKEIGLIRTKDFIAYCTKIDIENCGFSSELSPKVLVLWEAGVKYVAEYVAEYEFIAFLIGHGFDVLTAKEISEELGVELDEDIALIEEEYIDKLKCLDIYEKKKLKGVVQAAKTAQTGVSGDAGMDDARMNYPPKFVDYLTNEGFSGADAKAVAVKLGIKNTELCVCVTDDDILELRVLTDEDHPRAEQVMDCDMWHRTLTVQENLIIRGLRTLLQSFSNEESVNKYWRQHNNKNLVEFLKLNGIDAGESGRFADDLEMDDTDGMTHLSKGEIHTFTESEDTEEKIWRLRQMFVYMKERFDFGNFVDYLKTEGFSDNNAGRVATDLGIKDTVLCVCVSPAEIDALRVDYQSQSAAGLFPDALKQEDKWKIRNIIALLTSSSKVQVVEEWWSQHYDANAVEFFVKNGVERVQSQQFADVTGLKVTNDLEYLNKDDIDQYTKYADTAASIWRLRQMLVHMRGSASDLRTIRKVADWAVREPPGVQCLLTQLGLLIL